MKKILAVAGLLVAALGANASVLDTTTVASAANARLFDTYHDRGTDFVFVKLPTGWSFVARDEAAQSHPVFRDESTGFVFVKLSSGWKFMPTDL